MGAEGENVEPHHGPGWIAELDYLRGFAIVAVVMNHVAIFSFAGKSPDIVYINLFLITMSGFGVTTFFFISGLVLANKYRPPVAIAGFYRRRLGVIIPPYIVVSTLFIMYLMIFSSAPSLDSIAIFYLTGSASHSLWYIVVLLQFYLLFPFIISLYDRFERKRLELFLIASCLIIQIAWNSISVLLEGSLSMVILDRNFLSYLLFFVLGIYVARNIERVKSWISKISWRMLIGILLISFTATAGAVYYSIQTPIVGVFSVFNFYLVTFPAWPALMLVSYRISMAFIRSGGAIAEGIKGLGRASFGIYLLHFFVLSAIVAILVRIGIRWDNLIFYPIELIGSIALSYLLVLFISKMPRSEWIIGK